MPLTRYQIRDEYSLADPELYKAVDKDDPEALLEGVAMAGLVGVLRQLGDLAEFAAEIFHDLHEEVMATAARGHSLTIRVQQLEADFPCIEKAFLSQTSHSSLFYSPGVEWHPNMHMDQNLISQGDMPRFVMDSYEESRGPPRLFLLDKFDVAGAGACLKRYTDPSFFKADSSCSKITNAELHRQKKIRKAKKKASRWRNRETPEVQPTSHAKLHQLFLEESVENHINNPSRRVKLKRRLNEFPFDSKINGSYMGKFLKTLTPNHEVDRDIIIDSKPMKLPSHITGDSRINKHDISSVASDEELLQIMGNPCSSSDAEDTGQELSTNELKEDLHYEFVEASKLNCISESDDRLSQHRDEVNGKEVEVDGQSKLEGSFDGYPSDDIASEVDNYMDALTTMDSEIETDNEFRAKNAAHSLNSGNPGMDSDENEDENDSQPQHSDSKSVGNSTGTDETNSDPRNDFLRSDSLSNVAEDTLFYGDVSGKIVPPSEMHNTQTVNMLSVPVHEDSQFAENGVRIEEDDTQRYGSEFGNPSCADSLTDFTPVLLPVDSRKSLSEDASVGPELDEVCSNSKEPGACCADVVGMRTDLGDSVPCKSKHSDCSSPTRDDFLLELSSENHSVNYSGDEGQHILTKALLHRSNISDLAPGEGTNNLSGDVLQVECVEDVCSQNALVSPLNSVHSVALQTEEEQQFGSAIPETCFLDKGSNGRVPEVDDSPLFPAVMAVSSSSVVSRPEATDLNQQLEKAENVIPCDSVELKFAYCGGKNLSGVSSASDEEASRLSHDTDCVIKNDADLKFSSDLCESPDSQSLSNVHQDNVATDGVHAESVAFSTVASTHSGVEEDAQEDSSAGSPKLQEDSVSRLQDSRQIGLEIKETSLPDHPQESRIPKDAHQKPASSDLDFHFDGAGCSDDIITQGSLSACPPKLVEECSSIVQDKHLNGSEINEASLPMNVMEPVVPKEVDELEVTLSDSDYALCNGPSCEYSNSKFRNCVPSTSEIGPPSNEQHQDSELNSFQQLDVAENAVTSPSDHITELKLTSEELLESQDAQSDVGSWHEQEVSESESKIIVTNSNTQLKFPAEEVVELQEAHFDVKSCHEQEASECESTQQISVTDSNTEPKFLSEQVVELQDAHFDVESWHDEKISESESTQPISVSESKEKAVALPTSCTQEPRFPYELNELQEQEFDVISPHDDNIYSEPVQSPSYFDKERSKDVWSDPSAAYLSTEPLVFGHFDSKEQTKDPSISVDSFSLLSEVSHIELDEMPPLPPLPPMQWRMGKGQNSTSTSGRGLSGHNLSFTLHEQVQVGHLQVEPSLTSCSENENQQHGHEDVLGNMVHSSPSLQVPDTIDHKNSANDFPSFGGSQFTNTFLVRPTLESENSEYGSFISDGETTKHNENVEDVAHYSGFLQEKLAQPVNQLDGETSSEVDNPGEIVIISEGKGVNLPDATSSPITIDEDHIQHSLPTSEGQNVWSMSMSYPFPSHGDRIPNGNKHMKLPRPRSPLIDAVAAHDKSKLRKVTERVRPRIGQEVEERDSLLEQIRAKSFNLKPAVVTRPSIQGPKTNLRVAAILEKANAIRQALAGSDDEDDDADSWSDS